MNNNFLAICLMTVKITSLLYLVGCNSISKNNSSPSNRSCQGDSCSQSTKFEITSIEADATGKYRMDWTAYQGLAEFLVVVAKDDKCENGVVKITAKSTSVELTNLGSQTLYACVFGLKDGVIISGASNNGKKIEASSSEKKSKNSETSTSTVSSSGSSAPTVTPPPRTFDLNAQTYELTNLRSNWDAKYAYISGPYTSPGSVWYDLATNPSDGTINGGVSWVGSGSYSSPYAASFDGTGLIDFGATTMLNQTKMLFFSWLNLSSATSTDKIILGNSSDATANGFTLRQSSEKPGRLQFIVGSSTLNNPAPDIYSSVVLADNPVGYWPLGETSGTSASNLGSGNFTGTYVGSVTKGVNGAINSDSGTAVLLDGASYVSTPRVSTLIDNFSMEAWIYPTSFSGQAKFVMYNGNDSGGYGIAIGSDYSSATLNYLQGMAGWFYSGYTFTSTNKWYHVVVTRDAGTANFYVNGALISSVATQSPQAVQNAFEIGHQPQHSARYFPGAIDEAAFYETVLSPARVLAHYNAGIAYLYNNTCSSATTFSSNAWNSVAGLFDGSTAKLFVNGKEECSVAVSGNLLPAASNLVAGATSTNTKNWTGLISDLKIYGTTGAVVGTSTTIKNNFDVTADRYRVNPVGNIVQDSLLVNLDAANADGMRPATNCNNSWTDLVNPSVVGIHNGLNCSGSRGFQGTGIPTDPYRFSFDTLSSLSLPNMAVTSSPVTLEFWLRSASTTPSGLFDSAPSAANVLRNNSSGVIEWWNGAPNLSFTLPAATWVHLVFEYYYTSGTTRNISWYKNGAFQSTVSAAGSNTANMTTFTLGRTSDGAAFQGDIAKAAIYSKQLTPAEISQNCAALQSRYEGVTCN